MSSDEHSVHFVINFVSLLSHNIIVQCHEIILCCMSHQIKGSDIDSYIKIQLQVVHDTVLTHSSTSYNYYEMLTASLVSAVHKVKGH